MAAQLTMVVAAMVALTATSGASAAGLAEIAPANMIQVASECYDTMVQNVESMATVLVTGTPFSDKSCFVGCLKELLGPMGSMVQREAENAVHSVPPPMRQCAEIALGKMAGASENECQRIVDAAQCTIVKVMGMFA